MAADYTGDCSKFPALLVKDVEISRLLINVLHSSVGPSLIFTIESTVACNYVTDIHLPFVSCWIWLARVSSLLSKYVQPGQVQKKGSVLCFIAVWTSRVS